MMRKAQHILPDASRSVLEKVNNPSIWGLFLLISVLLAGCIESSPRLERLLSLQIHTTDLPSGWYVSGVAIGDRDCESEGIIARWIEYRGVPDKVFPSVQVSQGLIDYPELDQATSAYAQIVKEEFPVEEWIWPEQIVLVSRADQFRLACLERRVDIHDNVDERFRGSYFCTAVGQYDTIVSILYANVFRDQWLTFDDLQRLLKAADARLADQP